MAGASTVRRLDVVLNIDSGDATSTLQSVSETGDETAEALGGAEGKARALTIAFGALAATTAALGTAMARMAQSGMQIDSTLATIQTTSSATASEMDQIRDKITDIGAELPVTLNDVTRAFEELSYAGFSAQESIAAVGAVSNLAIAGQLQVAESARIVTSTLNAFNMEAEQAGAVASALASTFASSATTIQELGQALEYIGPVAGQAGQSIIEVSAALGVLADAGIRASRAGTGLQRFFSSLINPTGRAQDALNELGLTIDDFTDQNGEIKNMTELVSILDEEMAGLSQAERMQMLIDLFGQEGARSIAPLIENIDEFNEKVGQNAAADFQTAIEDFQELSDEELATIDSTVVFDVRPDMSREDILNEIVGLADDLSEEEISAQLQYAFDIDEETANLLAEDVVAGAGAEELANGLDAAVTEAELASAQLETVGGMVDYLKGSFSSAAYSIYTGFRPALKAVLGVAIDFIDVINENETALKLFGGALAGIFAALVALTGIVGVAAARFWVQAAAASSSATAMGLQAGAASGLAFAQKTAAAATWIMTASLGDLKRAMVTSRAATIATSLSLAGLRSALWGAAVAVRGFFAALGPVGWLILLVSAALTAYMTNLFGFRDFVHTLISPLVWLKDALSGVVDAIGWFAGGLAMIAGFGITGIIKGVAWAISAVGNAIRGVIGWFDDLPLLGKLIMGALFPPLAIMWGIQEAIDELRDGFDALKDAISMPEFNLLDQIKEAIDGIDPLRTIFEGVVDAVHDVARAFGFLVGAAKRVGDEIHDTFWRLQQRISDLPVVGWLVPDPKGEPKNMGEKTGMSLTEGFKNAILGSDAQEKAGKGLSGKIASFLPSSDAEEGPLSNLSERGRELVRVIQGGAESETFNLDSAVDATMQGGGVVDQAIGNATMGAQMMQKAVGGGAGGGGTTVNIEMTNHFGPGADEEAVQTGLQSGAEDMVSRVKDALSRDIERSRTNPSPS